MMLLDTFDSDEEAQFLYDKLKKNHIAYEEKKTDGGLQVLINEADAEKLNALIRELD